MCVNGTRDGLLLGALALRCSYSLEAFGVGWLAVLY